jgi:hypothetical protein
MNYGFRLLTNYDKENKMENILFLDTFEIILYCLVVRISNSFIDGNALGTVIYNLLYIFNFI